MTGERASRLPQRATEPCGNPHCTGKRLVGQLACWGCWSALPTVLRARIVSAWSLRSDPEERAKHSEAVLEARQRWAKIAGKA